MPVWLPPACWPPAAARSRSWSWRPPPDLHRAHAGADRDVDDLLEAEGVDVNSSARSVSATVTHRGHAVDVELGLQLGHFGSPPRQGYRSSARPHRESSRSAAYPRLRRSSRQSDLRRLLALAAGLGHGRPDEVALPDQRERDDGGREGDDRADQQDRVQAFTNAERAVAATDPRSGAEVRRDRLARPAGRNRRGRSRGRGPRAACRSARDDRASGCARPGSSRAPRRRWPRRPGGASG